MQLFLEEGHTRWGIRGGNSHGNRHNRYKRGEDFRAMEKMGRLVKNRSVVRRYDSLDWH